MNTFVKIILIIVIAAILLLTAGCTTTAVSPDEVVEIPPTNTPEPMDTATAVLLLTATSPPTPQQTVAPSPTWTPAPDADALFQTLMQQGKTYAEEGEWQKSADVYLAALAIDPDNERVADAYNNLGLSYQQLGELEQAVVNFDQAITLEPDTADFYANRADAWRALEEMGKALADYNRAIELDPEMPRYFVNRALVYKQLVELELALTDYDQAILLDPEYASAYLNRANLYVQLGDYNQAMADYDRFVTLDPTNKLGFLSRGLLHMEQGDLEGVQADLTQVTTLCKPTSSTVNGGSDQDVPVDDDCTRAYLYLAPVDYELGYYEAGLEDLEMGVSEDPVLAVDYFDYWLSVHPTSGFAFFARGMAEEILGDLAAVQADYTQAIQLSDSDPLLQVYYFRRGFVSVMQEDGDGAIADWQQAVAIEPTYAEAYFYLGLVYSEMGDFEAAIANLQQTITIEPTYTEAYYYLGTVYSLMEEYETAVTTLQTGLSQDIPQDDKIGLANLLVENAVNLIIRSGEDSSQGAKAMATLQSLVTEMPEVIRWGSYLNNVCWYGSLREPADDVMFACELAVELEPENGSIRDNRGLARALTGDFAGAIEDFQFYITWAPNHRGTPEAIAQREVWIEALQAGTDPFDDTVLAELRGE